MFKLPSITSSLIQSASNDGLKRNTFRIFGLRSDATGKQIETAINELRVHLELGERGNHAFAPSQLDDGDIAQAGQRIRDSVTRFCDECFWFWPLDLGSEDVALDYIAQGDKKGAEREWMEFLEHAEWGPVAKHNLSVLALHESVEYPHSLLEFGKYAAEFLASKVCEARVKARLKSLDEPRLPRGSADAFMHDWRLAIVRVLVRAALSHAEAGESKLAEKLAACAREVAGDPSVSTAVAESEFEQKLRDLDDRCQRNPESVSEVEWRSLVRDCKHTIERMRIFQGLSSRSALARNEVAAFLIRLSIHSHNKLDDSQGALRLLDNAGSLASGDTLVKVRENKSELEKIIRQNASAERLNDVVEKIKGVHASGIHVSTAKVEVVLNDLDALASALDDTSELTKLYDALGRCLRNLAIDAYNNNDDIDNSERLLNLAEQVTKHANNHGMTLGELGYKLIQDRMALESNRRVASRNIYSGSSSSGNSCMVALIALLCLTAAAGYATPIAAKAVHAWVADQLR